MQGAANMDAVWTEPCPGLQELWLSLLQRREKPGLALMARSAKQGSAQHRSPATEA